MGAITLKNFRTTADVTMNTRLKDGGVSIDWAGLTNIKAWLFSDAQKAIAGRCDVSINQADSTLLVCEYSASKPQYLGVNRLIVQAKYQGRTKTYDVPVFNFVSRTAAATGTVTIDDPTVDVEIVVEDVSSSILDNIIAAALDAAARAEAAAQEAEHMVDIHTGPEGKSAYEVAVAEGYTGTEEEWLASLKGPVGETPDISIGTVTTVEPGQPAGASMGGTPEAPVLNLAIPKGAVGATPNITVGTVTTGQPGTPVVITITGTAEAPVLNVQIPQGMKGDTGVSADYPITIHNGLDSDATDEALSAFQGKVLDGKVTQLEAKVDSLPRGKDYGFFTSSSLLPSGATEEGFAYVGATEPYAIWQFDGTSWTDSGVTANAFTANNEQVQDAVDDYLDEHPTVSGTFLNTAKRKLISLLEKVAFIDGHGQDYIDELTAWLFLAPIDHISAVYTQGDTKIYDIYSLDKLKDNLVVTVYFTDGSSSVVTDYTLTGNLVGGTSTITVSVYDVIAQRDVTGTFNVSVIGTTKLYIDGDECTALTGGWQVKGFNLTGGSPSATKESSYLFIKFAASATSGGAARTFSTVNKIPLTGLTMVIVESEAWNEGGRCNDTLYFTASVNESTTQAGAFGSDQASHRAWIISVPQEGTLVNGFKNTIIPGSLAEAYVSINANAFTSDNTYFSAGTYWKIKKVALAAE